MIKLETRTVFHCKCERCGYEWDSFQRNASGQLVSMKPKRCSSCKYRTWNGEDQRFADPYKPNGSPWARTPVPKGSRIAVGTSLPGLHLKAVREAFQEARAILAEIVEDNPCPHGKEGCACPEKRALAKVDRQMELLAEISGKASKHEAGQKEEPVEQDA